MIKLRIKKQSIGGGPITEEVIDYDGIIAIPGKGFITENKQWFGTNVTWCPILAMNGWEVIEEVKS